MGLNDRDYIRELDHNDGIWSTSRATVILVIVLCATYALQVLAAKNAFGPDPLRETFGLSIDRILEKGHVWRIVTSAIFHQTGIGSFIPFVFAMVVLYYCGSSIEGTLGTIEFASFVVFAAISTQLGLFAFLVVNPLQLPLPNLYVGSSAIVTACLVRFACLSPNTTFRIWFVIPVKVKHIAMAIVLFNLFWFANAASNERGRGMGDVSGILLVLGGAAFGFMHYSFDWRTANWFSNSAAKVSRKQYKTPRLRIATPIAEEEDTSQIRMPVVSVANVAATSPIDEQLEAKLDLALEKVARTGKDSLTSEEKAVLMRASEIYKRKRTT